MLFLLHSLQLPEQEWELLLIVAEENSGPGTAILVNGGVNSYHEILAGHGQKISVEINSSGKSTDLPIPVGVGQ
jgi:hypothetical protein